MRTNQPFVNIRLLAHFLSLTGVQLLWVNSPPFVWVSALVSVTEAVQSVLCVTIQADLTEAAPNAWAVLRIEEGIRAHGDQLQICAAAATAFSNRRACTAACLAVDD